MNKRTNPQRMWDAVVVGKGFSGIATVIHLLNSLPKGASLLLLHKDPGVFTGGGVAYGSSLVLDSNHLLLNVPAAKMSAFPDKPNDFVDYLQLERGMSETVGKEFVPRHMYRSYLMFRLQTAILDRGSDVIYKEEAAHVVELDMMADEAAYTIVARGGRTYSSKTVVVCTGNHPAQKRFTDQPMHGYIHSPWDLSREEMDTMLEGLKSLKEPEKAKILLIGSGLTMIDLFKDLRANGFQGKIYYISRRGQLPRQHRENELEPIPVKITEEMLEHANSPRKLLSAVLTLIRTAQSTEQNWRDVINGLRPWTSKIWSSWTVRQQRQFMRHLQVFWDTHRHRAAYDVIEALEAEVWAETVVPLKGRIRALMESSSERDGVPWKYITAVWGSTRMVRGELQRLDCGGGFDLVFNCTGPDNRPRNDVLLSWMANYGVTTVRENQLGISVDPDLEVLDVAGARNVGLFYVGPMLKSQHWEATAVPELRGFARKAADGVLFTLQELADAR